ncbi:MAG: penicillin acylase family protein [Cytophagales bacterium]|nr:penicillin acylase family protein [Cytophagales bacterium]
MRLLKTVFVLLLTLGTTFFLDNKWEEFPPLGPFLSPTHGFWANAKKEDLSVEEVIGVPHLRDEVRVYWDKHNIAHVVASNDHDLYVMQGYLTAFHRLWQMNTQVRKTAGRLSEVFGEDLLDFDRLQRRRGFAESAERMAKHIVLNDTVRSMVLAYTSGVNDYISQLAYKDYPFEYKLLGYEPEPWSAEKTCLLQKEMSSTLSFKSRDLENTNFLRSFGKDNFDLLYPESVGGLPDQRFMVEDFVDDFEAEIPPVPIGFDSIAFSSTSLPRHGSSVLDGSTVLAISPEKSATGNALFASQPDLDLSIPSLWYLIHLQSPSLNVMGASIPGFPGIVIGFNDSLAWGTTNGPRDNVDWYLVQFADETRDNYHYGENLHKTQHKIEEIDIRGRRAPFRDTLIFTHHGPVTYDRNFPLSDGNPSYDLSLRWSGHDLSNEPKVFYKINRASDLDSFYDAISGLLSPPQNVSFAHIGGDIGIWAQGYFPIKWAQQGVFILDGSDPSHDWGAAVPQDHVIYSINPDVGYLSSANERPVDPSSYPYYTYYGWYEHYRGRRLKEILDETEEVSVQDIMNIQNDNFNYVAFEILPILLDSLDTKSFKNEESQLYKRLSSWNYFNEADLSEPVYFEVWYELFRNALWDEILALPGTTTLPTDLTTAYLLKNYPSLPFWDNVVDGGVESLGATINRTYQLSLGKIRLWKKDHPETRLSWAAYKATSIKHLLKLPGFGVDNVWVGGRDHTLNAVTEDHGPSLRLIVELDKEKGPQAWMIYPGTQSGNPSDPSYHKWVKKWANGEYLKLLFSAQEEDIREHAKFVQEFFPIK